MDYCAVVRRDHDDLDLALAAMLDPATLTSRLPELLDAFRLGLAVHLVAEARVLESLLQVDTRPPDALRWVVSQLQREHVAQRAAADELTRIEPGSPRWYDHGLQLRVALLDHSTRHEYIRASLDAHVCSEEQRRLAAQFATERLRVLATTCPLEIAQRVRAA